jgi:hypothetical protein
VSYQVETTRSTVFLDVDLPEIEVMPDRLCVINAKKSEHTRVGMRGLNFSNTDQIDPIAALKRFQLVRNMTATCIFRSIEPLKTTVGTR